MNSKTLPNSHEAPPTDRILTVNIIHTDTNRGKIVRLKCMDCCGGQAAEVRRCTAFKCPLWAYRMGGSSTSKAQRDANMQAIRDAEDSGHPEVGAVMAQAKGMDILPISEGDHNGQ